MKKIFFAAIAALAMASCGNKAEATLSEAENDSLNAVVEQIEAIAPEAQAVIENDAELKALVEKATAGELTDAEKTTLWQRLKAIGVSAVKGEESLQEAGADALNELKNADTDEIGATATTAAAAVAGEKAAEKTEKAVETVKEVKEAAETTKEAVDAAKNVINSLKK